MAESFVRPLIDFEIKLGYTSTLICNSNKCNINSHQVNFKIGPYNFFYIIFIIIYLAIFLKYKKTEVITVHNSSSAIIPLLAGKLIGVKQIIYMNHGVPYIAYSNILKKILFFLEKCNCFLADTIITVSIDMKQELQKLTKKNILIIHHGSACGIDLNYFNKKKYNIESIKKKINLSKNQFVIVYVGRTEIRKGFIFLLSLWEKYFANDKRFKLLICGNNIKMKEISNIKYLGFVDNIPSILAISDCLILPSHHEGLPYAILESLSSECPIIASDIPGTRSLLKNNENGILIKNFDEKEYYKKIIYLKNNINFRDKIIKKGLIVSKKYCRKKFLVAYRIFLESILLQNTNQ